MPSGKKCSYSKTGAEYLVEKLFVDRRKFKKNPISL